MNNRVFSLYRSYLRQVRALPHTYLRHFFTIKGADDFRSVLKTKSVQLRRTKLKRLSKNLQRLQAANAGKSIAFDRILDIAYGRIGKLRWELMEPLLLNTNTPPIKPRTDDCLPVYSSELIALLTSGISHTTRPLQKHQLALTPPSRPKDRALLGSPSKRREYNIQWRFFRNERKKVYPPLRELQRHTASHRIDVQNQPSNSSCQDTNPLQELLALAGLPSRSPNPPGKRRRQQIQNVSDARPFCGSLSSRWLRRRYQALLGRIPLLVPRPLPQHKYKCIYDVRLADSAITTSRTHPPRLRSVDADDVSWMSDITLIQQYEGRRQ